MTKFVGNNHVIISGNPASHHHAPDPAAVDEFKLRNNLKRQAEHDSGPPARIIRKVAAEFSVGVNQRFTNNAQKKVIQRHRPCAQPPPNPGNQEFVIPEKSRVTFEGGLFYRGEVTDDNGGKALVFAADDDLRRLALSRYWLADATFDTVPGEFRQMFTVHGSVGPDHVNTVPVVFVLMTKKSQSLYQAVLSHVSEVAANIGIELNPTMILTDFELAMINAFSHEFKGASQVGCFFHFSQNLWKKVQKSGLVSQFSSQGLNDHFKRLQALAFLPAEDVPQGLALLDKQIPEVMRPLVTYLENTYVLGRIKPGTSLRTQPMFSPALWSVYNNVLNSLPRTTNNVEAWHSRWAKLVGESHVGTFRIIEEMRLEQKASVSRASVWLAGGATGKRKETIDKDVRLQRVVQNYKEYQLLDYINAVASNLSSK